MLSVLAHTVCVALRHRLPRYATATPETLHRRLLDTGGVIEHHGSQMTIRLSRTHLLTGAAPGQPPQDDHRALVGAARPSATSTTDWTGGRFA